MKNLLQSIVALVALRPSWEWAVQASFSSIEGALHDRMVESNVECAGIRLLSKEELADERIARKKRMRERRERARDLLKTLPPPQQAERMTTEEVNRHLSWFGGSSSVSTDSYSAKVLLDASAEYDKWAQAYRMLGGYIDCDHPKSDGDHHSGSGDNNNNQGESSACSRWMIWAAYVNPNYQGYEYNEYFGDEPVSQLDCHNPDTEWQLLGVYRQEFYQYIEQISKHLWAIDEYEYVVALAGLAYMTDEECYAVGYGNDGSALYASVAPQEGGRFAMGIYKDEYCLQLDDSGVSFDDFGLQNDIDLGSKDATDDDGKAWAYDWWYDTQEASFEQLNDVYDRFRYCTSCVDYPTYQDGYFIGDYGTDDDDLINQCWKFWSHDSYTCEADCLAQADAQGSLLAVNYGGKTFGSYSGISRSQTAKPAESSLTRLLANAFLTLSFLLFVATFLAFAVARRSRYRESRSSRSRRLLDDDRSRRSRRKSRTRGEDGDGLFKEKSHSGHSRSRSKRSSSRNSRRSSSRRSKSYEAPSRKSGATDDDY